MIPTSNCLPMPSIALPKSSYFIFLIFSKLSDVVLIAPLVLDNAFTASAPKSSHIVPNKLTPAVFCTTSSPTSFRAVITSLNALLASSPPCANCRCNFSAFNPNASKANAVVSLPSFARIPNSFIASPNLSISNTPLCAPLLNILIICSALNPNCLKCTEYSLILSSKLSFLLSPFCAPCAIRLYASSEVNPNCFIIISTLLILSFTSISKVSLIASAFSVVFSSSSLARPV